MWSQARPAPGLHTYYWKGKAKLLWKGKGFNLPCTFGSYSNLIHLQIMNSRGLLSSHTY